MFDKDNILTSPREIALDPNAYEPLRIVLEDSHKSRWTKLLVTTIICFALVLFGGAVIWGWAYPTQMGDPGFWHVSLVSLLYWIGISQALVALSAILRITHASWRYPLNRLLDIGSLFGLWMPLLLPVLILARGRVYTLGMAPGNSHYVWDDFGSFAWDGLAVGTGYLAGWMLLYLTSLPDFAMLRDRAAAGTKEKTFYGRMAGFRALYVKKSVIFGPLLIVGSVEVPTSFGLARVQWTGADHQWRVLRRAEGVLVVGILASFIGSQTVLGWDFQLAAARNWDSSIFAPLYTLSSLLGALALAVLIMTVANRLLRGRGFFTLTQYDSLGKFMVGIALLWTYFRICDFLTAWYGHIPEEWMLQQSRTVLIPVVVGLMVLRLLRPADFRQPHPVLPQEALGALHDQRLRVGRRCVSAVFGHRADVRAEVRQGGDAAGRPGLSGVFQHHRHAGADVPYCRALLPAYVLVGNQQGAHPHRRAQDGQRDGNGHGGRSAAVGNLIWKSLCNGANAVARERGR